jgi:hypothetical protein
MYRTSTTPSNAAGRRSTRSARGSAKRRRSDGSGRGGAGGGLKQKFEQAAQRSAKKWVKIWRPPASTISFKVQSWVPFSTLTEEERLDYEAKKEKEAQLERLKQSEEGEKEAVSQEHNKAAEASKDVSASGRVEGEAGASESTRHPTEEATDITMPDQPVASLKRPVDESAGQGEEEEPSTKRTKIEVPAVKNASDDTVVTAPQERLSTIPQPVQPTQEAQSSSQLAASSQGS